MLSSRDITLMDRHLPDKSVDTAISFPTKTNESRELPSAKDITTSLAPFHWLTINKDENDSPSMTALNECHLPDEYVDAVISYFDNDSDTSASEELPSASELLRYIFPSHWLRHNDDTTKQFPVDPTALNEINLNECHLPDEYVDALISYDSSGDQGSWPAGDLIGSIIALRWLGSNANSTEKPRHATKGIFLNDCHLPDEYVDAVQSIHTEPSEAKENPSAKDLKSKSTKTESVEPYQSYSLDLFMESKIMSDDYRKSVPSRNTKVSFALEKVPITEYGRINDPGEEMVPSAKLSARGTRLRRRSTRLEGKSLSIQ